MIMNGYQKRFTLVVSNEVKPNFSFHLITDTDVCDAPRNLVHRDLKMDVIAHIMHIKKHSQRLSRLNTFVHNCLLRELTIP